jgi:hypothetical protein
VDEKIENVCLALPSKIECVISPLYNLCMIYVKCLRVDCNAIINFSTAPMALILQKKSLEERIYLFYQPHIHICCERILLFLRNMFKFLGHTQFLEICTGSKEIMLFHDNGFVLSRFAYGFN